MANCQKCNNEFEPRICCMVLKGQKCEGVLDSECWTCGGGMCEKCSNLYFRWNEKMAFDFDRLSFKEQYFKERKKKRKTDQLPMIFPEEENKE